MTSKSQNKYLLKCKYGDDIFFSDDITHYTADYTPDQLLNNSILYLSREIIRKLTNSNLPKKFYNGIDYYKILKKIDFQKLYIQYHKSLKYSFTEVNEYEHNNTFMLNYEEFNSELKEQKKHIKTPLGRLYNNCSISSLPSKIRNTIFYYSGYDEYDQRNAHYSIIYNDIQNNINTINNILKKELKKLTNNDKYKDSLNIANHTKDAENIINNGFTAINKYVNQRKLIIEEMKKTFKIKDTNKEPDNKILKRLPILIIYGSNIDKWKYHNNIIETNNEMTNYFDKLKFEISLFIKIFIMKNPALTEFIGDVLKKSFEVDDIKQIPNFEAKLLSLYLLDKEAKLNFHIKEFLKSKKYIDDTFYFLGDALFIKKPPNDEDITELINNEIKEKFNYSNFYYDKKNLTDKYFTIEEIEQETDEDNKITTYEELKIEFEKRICKARKPKASYIEIVEEINPITKQQEIATYESTKQELIDEFLDYQYTYYDKKEQQYQKATFIKKWITDEKIRVYERVLFLPMMKPPPNCLNLFTKLNVESREIIKDDLKNSLLWQHLFNVICSKDKKQFEYILKWMANIIKKPYEKSGVALVLRSKEGAGKDIFFSEWFGSRFLGELWFKQVEAKNIFSNFNSLIKTNLLCVITETKGSTINIGDMSETIKSFITNPKVVINEKNVKEGQANNFSSFIFFTNYNNPIKISPNERRFHYIDVNNEKCKNTEYFNNLMKEIKTGIYDKAFYNYLMALNIENMNFQNERPKTNLYYEVREVSEPPEVKFLKELNLSFIRCKGNYELYIKTLKDSINKFNFDNPKCPSDIEKVSLSNLKVDLKKAIKQQAKFLNNEIKLKGGYIFDKFKIFNSDNKSFYNPTSFGNSFTNLMRDFEFRKESKGGNTNYYFDMDKLHNSIDNYDNDGREIKNKSIDELIKEMKEEDIINIDDLNNEKWQEDILYYLKTKYERYNNNNNNNNTTKINIDKFDEDDESLLNNVLNEEEKEKLKQLEQK